MVKPRRANRDLIKAMNRNLLLNIIRREGPLSRTKLTEASGLSVGAVSQITNDLIAEDWIIEVGESESTGGRRPILLRFNPTAGYVLGLKLMEDRIVCAVTDLDNEVVEYIERFNTARAFDAVSSAIVEIIRDAVRISGIASQEVMGVGIGLAGVIDCQQGIVHYSPFFHWQEQPLADHVAEQLAMPVYIENDVNTLTITEQLYGDGLVVEDFVVVTVGRGVGLGMVLNHQLYHSEPGGAGELGHITVAVDGPVCGCGKRGCLEALAADPAVVRYVEDALAAGAESAIDQPISIAHIIAAADAGDTLAQEALAVSGRWLGVGLSTVVNMLRPSRIIISGEGVAAGDHRLQPMIEAMRANAFNGLLDDVTIIVKPTDDQTWARGAASLVVGKLFESPLTKRQEV
jgi:N-acetylglucosamine repressor